MPTTEPDFALWMLMEEMILTILSIAFVAWAGVVWRASNVLAGKLDEMRDAFNKHSLRTEHRLTVLEEKETRVLALIKSVKDRFEEHSVEHDVSVGKKIMEDVSK